jgi:hypothetical protein
MPGTRAVEELRQIPFSQLIGAPLKAAVEAQALAAQSTIEFIQKVGFKNPAGPGGEQDILFADQGADAAAGEVRSVTFTYQKRDENDAEATFQLTVPLLSISPIPYIRIDEMTIDFNCKLTDSVERNVSDDFTLTATVGGTYGAFWSPLKIDARVTSTYNRKSGTTERATRDYSMEIHVRAVQDEMPAGLSRVLDMLEASIKEAKQP